MSRGGRHALAAPQTIRSGRVHFQHAQAPTRPGFHLPRQSLRRGRQKSISPSRQWFSKVESAHMRASERIYPPQHSGVVAVAAVLFSRMPGRDCAWHLARIARGQTNRLTSGVTSPPGADQRTLHFSPLKWGRDPESQTIFLPPRYQGKVTRMPGRDCAWRPLIRCVPESFRWTAAPTRPGAVHTRGCSLHNLRFFFPQLFFYNYFRSQPHFKAALSNCGC